MFHRTAACPPADRTAVRRGGSAEIFRGRMRTGEMYGVFSRIMYNEIGYQGKRMRMKSVYDVHQLLKQFGTIVYVGDRLADLELMEEELKEIYRAQLIDVKEFQVALLILRQEIEKEKEKREKRKNG